MEELWCVTYQYHDKKEELTVTTEIVEAESIGEALESVASFLEEAMEKNEWSDYHVTSVNIIPELH